MADPALIQLLRQEAEALSGRLLALPRQKRQDARAVLWQAWQTLDGRSPRPTALVEVARALARVQEPLTFGDAARMRTLQPMSTVLRATLVADAADQWTGQLAQKWHARLALSRRRLAWWEARLSGDSPARVATVRPPDKQEREALELLHKRGRSPFS